VVAVFTLRVFTNIMTLTTIAALSGPLLLVPLGRAVLAHRTPVRPALWPQAPGSDQARGRQPAARTWLLVLGAGAAVLGAALPTGGLAGVAAGVWLVVTASLFGDEAWRWWCRGHPAGGVPTVVAWGWLPVAAGWFAASRAGVAPLGFGEPITLLTAAHFHVAGFGLSVLASTAAQRLGSRTLGKVAWVAWALVTAGPVCVAVGFTLDAPTLNMVGAFVVAAGVFGLCPCLIAATDGADSAGRWAGRLAAVVPLVPMVLAVAYSLGPVFGTPAPSIELMVRAHGIVNAVGFVALGLAAFVLIERRERRRFLDLPEEVPGAVVA
jgi:YndJ-like protein